MLHDGTDPPIIVNEQGGKQHAVSYAFTELDPDAMFLQTEILAWGAKTYGHRNWVKIPIEDHLNHALIHIFSYLAGDRSESHLGNLMCRAMFAAALDIENKAPVANEVLCRANPPYSPKKVKCTSTCCWDYLKPCNCTISE